MGLFSSLASSFMEGWRSCQQAQHPPTRSTQVVPPLPPTSPPLLSLRTKSRKKLSMQSAGNCADTFTASMTIQSFPFLIATARLILVYTTLAWFCVFLFQIM